MHYEILDHTADVCIRIYGKSLRELFKNAACAMIDLMTDREKVKPSKKIKVEAEGETEEELLVRWLQKILYLHQVKKMFFCDFDVKAVGENKVKGTAFGEKIDLEKHEFGSDVKGVSYHDLELKNTGDTLRIDIIFDL